MSSQSVEFERDASAGQLLEQASQFDGPPEQFLDHLLAVQCRLSGATAAAIMRLIANQPPNVLALYPTQTPGSPAPAWLNHARQHAAHLANAPKPVTRALPRTDSLYGQPDTQHLILLPLRAGQNMRGLAAFVVEAQSPDELDRAAERLELSAVLLSLYEMRLTLQQRNFDMHRLRQAQELLAAVNDQTRFKAAAMAMCNELASRFSAERVSLGFIAGRYVKLAAISHTEKFTRKMALVQDVEAAMEECADQDLEIIHPRPDDAVYVDRATRELATRQGPAAICSIPLRREREARGVMTIERDPAQPFLIAEIETMRLAADLVTARLMELRDHDRWFGARWAAAARKGASFLVGSRHTWAKLLVIGVFAALVLLTVLRGADKVEAPFVIEAVQRQVIPAPFDAYIEQVNVEPNDQVAAGQTVLATLDTSELALELAAAKAELATYNKQADTALRDGKTVEAQIAQAEADQVAARITLIEYQISRARLISPIDGIVIAGDLKQQLGAPVRKGDVLFEVAPLESLRAVMLVGEDRINDLRKDGTLTGELATAAAPGVYVPFEVERINPVAEMIDQRNVFRVRVRLLESREDLAPGMEGVAKTEVGRRSYLYLWTRELVNWVRMKLWL